MTRAFFRSLMAESDELAAKMERLEAFTGTETFRDLSALDRDLLLDQRFAMRSYYKALSARIQRAV